MSDQLLIWQVLRNLRKQMMHTGHVAFGALHLPFPMQHNLKREKEKTENGKERTPEIE